MRIILSIIAFLFLFMFAIPFWQEPGELAKREKIAWQEQSIKIESEDEIRSIEKQIEDYKYSIKKNQDLINDSNKYLPNEDYAITARENWSNNINTWEQRIPELERELQDLNNLHPVLVENYEKAESSWMTIGYLSWFAIFFLLFFCPPFRYLVMFLIAIITFGKITSNK